MYYEYGHFDLGGHPAVHFALITPDSNEIGTWYSWEDKDSAAIAICKAGLLYAHRISSNSNPSTNVQIEDLRKAFTDEQIKDIIDYWNNNFHPYTCLDSTHGNLHYENGALRCDKCEYHQHWLNIVTVDAYDRRKKDK